MFSISRYSTSIALVGKLELHFYMIIIEDHGGGIEKCILWRSPGRLYGMGVEHRDDYSFHFYSHTSALS